LEVYSDVLCRTVARQTPDNVFNRFILLFIKFKEVDVSLSEEFLYDVVVHQTFTCDRVPVTVFWENSPLTPLLFLSGD
jgi:hypothetical protein